MSNKKPKVLRTRIQFTLPELEALLAAIRTHNLSTNDEAVMSPTIKIRDAITLIDPKNKNAWK